MSTSTPLTEIYGTRFGLIETAVKEDTNAQMRKLKLELQELELAASIVKQQAEQAALLRRIEQINDINRLQQVNQIRQTNSIN